MTKSEIVGLAERCEKAAGPDRETRELLLAAFEQIYPEDFGRGCDRYGRFLALLDARASLDAAMTLVPEATFSEISGPCFIGPRYLARVFESSGKSEVNAALALCAAALRARATLREHSNV